MKPEQKAKELIDKYIKVIKERTDVFNAYSDLSFAKELALICVDEILGAINLMESFAAREYKIEPKQYWQFVKLYLEKN